MGPRRRTTRLGIVALLAGALVPLSATQAVATPGCTTEVRPTIEIIPGVPVPSGDGCDDSTPPDTTMTASVAPNVAGLVNVNTVTFTLGFVVTDGDTDHVGFACRLAAPAQAHDWRQCTSPVTYTGLPDAAAGSYVFQARAVDLADAGRSPDSPLPPTTTDTPDHDPTPASLTWGQDTKAPFVFVSQSTYDEDTPTQPVVTSATVPIRINSSEAGSTLECTDNGAPVACSAGRWELRDPRAGRHTFSARAIDRAGNVSAWSRPIEFFVPTNLTRRRGWAKELNKNYLRGDALRAKKGGARLVLPRTKVGELRLVAPAGPRLGKVRIRVGRRAWHVVDLSGPKELLRQYTVIDRYSGMRSGRIVIETVGKKPVVIDAIVARPNTFPSAQ